MIETERLIIKPLTYNQLEKYILNDNSLEQELSLNETSRSISPELKEALEQTILPNVADTSKNYLYSTLWTLISKKDNKMAKKAPAKKAPKKAPPAKKPVAKKAPAKAADKPAKEENK